MKKARDRLVRIASQASILVVASHSDEIIRRFCTKAMWLTQGTIGAFGEVDAVLNAYHAA
jgi:ABC-2 type transport system ATP-binding protein/lipopolysaccharide transport system ATP-binding protein